MDASGLKAMIQTGLLPHIMFFTGNEWAVQDIFIKQISKRVELETKRVDSIADVASKFKAKSFVDKNYVYIARDDNEYIQSEKLQELVNETIGNNYYILLLTTVDKRTKFYKTNSIHITEFEPLKPAVLKKYIQKQIALSDSACDKLMEVCEYDYGRCLLEIDKINCYMKGVG